ncbi:MAG: relaxase/mobilization nuclease domain-containing protein [Desulfarculales bacterium]|jgi:hypothetical protein|nr:relaxase/mobilization nuclease domain-containing protein [Desulfarculales bacterium]
MTRKTASFSQLLKYINSGRDKDDQYSFKYNIYSTKPYYIVKEYIENYRNVKKRKKGISVFHEIIPLLKQNDISREEYRKILKDIMLEYSKMRARNNLIYGTIHEKGNQIHCHLMISSNEIENTKNLWYPKKQLAEFKIKLSEYVQQKYPQIKQYEKLKTRAKNNKEEAYKKRTSKPSDRELVQAILKEIFANSQSQQDFVSSLHAEKIQIYQRGNTFGFLDLTTNKKYRLKTLELESEFDKLNQGFNKSSKQNSNQDSSQNSFTGKKTMSDDRQTTQNSEQTRQNTTATNEAEYTAESEYSAWHTKAIHDVLRDIMENSKTYKDFIYRLLNKGIDVQHLDNTFVFTDRKSKKQYRLDELKLDIEYTRMKTRLSTNLYSKNKKEQATKVDNNELNRTDNDILQEILEGKHLNDKSISQIVIEQEREKFRQQINEAMENNKNNQNENSQQNIKSR